MVRSLESSFVPLDAGHVGHFTIFFNIFLLLALPLLTTCALRSLKTFDCRVQSFLKSSSASRLLGNAPARSINQLWPYFIHTFNQVFITTGSGAKVIDSNPHHDDDDYHIICLSWISMIATQQKAKYPKYPKYSTKYFRTFHEIVKKMMKKRKCSLGLYHGDCLLFSAKINCRMPRSVLISHGCSDSLGSWIIDFRNFYNIQILNHHIINECIISSCIIVCDGLIHNKSIRNRVHV